MQPSVMQRHLITPAFALGNLSIAHGIIAGAHTGLSQSGGGGASIYFLIYLVASKMRKIKVKSHQCSNPKCHLGSWGSEPFRAMTSHDPKRSAIVMFLQRAVIFYSYAC